MSIQRHRNHPGIVLGVSGVIGGIIAETGWRLSHAARAALIDAAATGLERGGTYFRQYVRNWATHFREELGNETNEMVQVIGQGLSEARRQGGQLYEALVDYESNGNQIIETAPSVNGEATHTRFIDGEDMVTGRSLLLLHDGGHTTRF